MKNLILYCNILFITFYAFTSFSQDKSVLFIGNSYTGSNGGVPAMFQNIASSLGDAVEVDSYTPGGQTFQSHSTNSTCLTKIASRDWDFVVLQEQSQRPAFPPAQVAAEVYPYAAVLCDSINSNRACTKPIFFLTWGHKNGDVYNCEAYPPICTYEGQQWRLRQSYVEMAETHNGWVAPCGMSFKSIRESNPEIELYTADNSHPTIHGTYLAACTFYSTIFHKSAIGADFPGGISENEANILQNAAWTVVTDSLDVWRIDTSKMQVEFVEEFPVGGNYSYAYFENFTQNADSCLWDFGDGDTLIQYPGANSLFEMVQHYYEEEGEYLVCLTGYKLCELVRVCIEIDFVITSIDNHKTDAFKIYPNPIAKNGLLYIEKAPQTEFMILSTNGKIVMQGKISDNEIDISGLSSGKYVLKSGNKQQKFIILE
jgi:hypothetical protein